MFKEILFITKFGNNLTSITPLQSKGQKYSNKIYLYTKFPKKVCTTLHNQVKVDIFSKKAHHFINRFLMLVVLHIPFHNLQKRLQITAPAKQGSEDPQVFLQFESPLDKRKDLTLAVWGQPHGKGQNDFCTQLGFKFGSKHSSNRLGM